MTQASAQAPIALARPDITEQEIEAVVAVLRSPTLSLGPKLTEFEEKFARVSQTRHAVACNSGTSALHLALRSMGIGPGDEVITTSFSFVASANCILFEGGTPVFADVDAESWCIDPAAVEAAITPRTRAIIPVDVFGVVPDLGAIRRLAERHGLCILEDSCEALGASYEGMPAGSLGTAGVFGFYPNKQITTGEGGMLTTDDDEIAALSRSMRNQGRGSDGAWLAHERLGYNYRLSEINCAIGCVQLDRLPDMLAARLRVSTLYDERLQGETRVRHQITTRGCEKSWFVYVIQLAPDYPPDARDRILVDLRAQGIGCSNYFSPIHLQPLYQAQYGHRPGELPVCEALSVRTLALPFHTSLGPAEVDRVVTALQAVL